MGAAIEFQSSPFPKEGRYPGATVAETNRSGFNPRPSRRKGATEDRRLAQRAVDVSILALPEGRALRLNPSGP
ncbi:MAG: hypothetical protein OJF47_004078 [Nitrospira sp.]|nr:MAG: hypothetical protein OJF47_004078 [Nitrospira sp.]